MEIGVVQLLENPGGIEAHYGDGKKRECQSVTIKRQFLMHWLLYTVYTFHGVSRVSYEKHTRYTKV